MIAALGGEGARQPEPVHSAFAAAARGLLAAIERKLHPRRPAPEPGEDALRLASAMVGTVVWARLVDDPALAQRLLAAAAPGRLRRTQRSPKPPRDNPGHRRNEAGT